MTQQEYKALSIREFSKAARVYETDDAGVYRMCKKDYPDVLEELEREPFTDLLDCGCGTAPMLTLLKQRYPDRHYTGIDLTPEMIEVARAKRMPGVELVVGDCEKLPFPDGSFDAVICCQSFHHYPNVQDFFDSVARVLRPGGRLILRDILPEAYRNMWIIVTAVVEYEILLLSLLSLIRRIRHQSLWKNSVTYMFLRVSSQVLEARAASTRMLIAYLLLIVLNFLFLRFFGTVGVVSVIVIDLAVLLYLLRDRLGNLSIRTGLRELSKGRLDYRIDTSSLTGESLEMAQAVNEMGDGLQEAVDAMVNSERLKAELITNLSHDLKTPLTSIINYVDLLKREEIGNERAKGYIEILERKSNRLKSLITDLIDVSRISSGNVELHMTTLDLHAMVQMAVGEFEDRFQEKGLTTEMEAARALPVSADGDMLWRVLDNLLGNIAKYAMPGSTVRIRIFEEAGKAVASFENQSKEKLEKSAQELEERFVRGDESRSSEGSGLGLSIAGSLTELMGGTFRIETTQTTFCATLQFDLQPMP